MTHVVPQLACCELTSDQMRALNRVIKKKPYEIPEITAESCALSVSHAKRSLKLWGAVRRAGLFLVSVGAATTTLIAVYEARAMLDAEAELYTVNATASSLETHPMTEGAAIAIVMGADAKTTPPEHSPGAMPSRGARADGKDEPQDVTSSVGAGRSENPRFTTIYVHRGADAPAAYVVPRE
jgi:hypothetical protein